MRKRRRAGISYILEVVMMTLVIVALSTVVLTWGLSQVSTSRVALTAAVNDRIYRTQESILIEDVQMVDPNHMIVAVRNIGSTQAVVDTVYINNVATTVTGICTQGNLPTQGSLSPPWVGPTSSCPSSSPGAKLPLSIGGLGFLEVLVPTTVDSAGLCYRGSAISIGSTQLSYVATFVPAFTSYPGNSQVSIVTSPPSWTSGAAPAPTPTPTGSSFTISFSAPTGVTNPTLSWGILGESVCSGTTYSVAAATSRGTTYTGSFTV